MEDIKVHPSLGFQDLYAMAMGFKKSQVLYTASSLGVFDELGRHESPRQAAEVAASLRLHPDTTERLLNACCSYGLIEMIAQPSGQYVYRNSVCAEQYLTKRSRTSIAPIISNIGEMYCLFSKLPMTVKDGPSKPEKIEAQFCEETGFFKSEDMKYNFLSAMHFFSTMDVPEVILSLDLAPYRSLVDLGGGTGALGYSLALTYPHIDVIVSDLKHVIKESESFLPKFLPENLSFESKNFFTDPLTNADIYILSHVVHDWHDSAVNIILEKVYKSILPGGCLLLLEKVLDDDKTGPPTAVGMDLNMMVGTGGRERTEKEYVVVLERHGFSDVVVKKLHAARFRDVIVAQKSQKRETDPEL